MESNNSMSLSRDPAGFTGMAVLKDGRIIVDDIIDKDSWEYFCENILFDEQHHIGLAGVFKAGIVYLRDLDFRVKMEEVSVEPTGNVYFMSDSRNGFIKIGISGDPTVREATLQSEAPTITLIQTVFLQLRSDSRSLERLLHKKFSEKRKRGEWFSLSSEEYLEATNFAIREASKMNRAARNVAQLVTRHRAGASL